jgi:hypothetical protein
MLSTLLWLAAVGVLPAIVQVVVVLVDFALL